MPSPETEHSARSERISRSPPPPLDGLALLNICVEACADCGPDVQVSVRVIIPTVVSAIEAVPLVAFVPDQPSPAPLLLAVHEAALVEDQVTVVACPNMRLVGFADIETDGTVSVTTASPTSPCEPEVQ